MKVFSRADAAIYVKACGAHCTKVFSCCAEAGQTIDTVEQPQQIAGCKL